MRIASFRPEPDTPGSEPQIVAWFDVHLSPDVRLNHLVLRRNGTGRLVAYPPKLHGTRSAHFAPALTDEITEAAVAAYETFLQGGRVPHARTYADA